MGTGFFTYALVLSILGLVVMGIGIMIQKRVFQNLTLSPGQRKRRMTLVLVIGLLGLLLFMFTGRLVPFLIGLTLFLILVGKTSRYLGLDHPLFHLGALIKKWIAPPPHHKKQKNKKRTKRSKEKQTPQQPQNNTSMTPDEAYHILGLDEKSTKKDILGAHKHLIQKVHPDQGGSAHLAAQVNQARDILLRHRKT